jgi:hypothetical protein
VRRLTSKLGDAAEALWALPRTHLACAAVLSCLAVAGSAAGQQQVPSDDELRSMYCVEVIREEIELQHHLISASDAAAASATTPALRQQWIDTSAELLQGLARLEVLRYRLQSYMLPRIPALNSLSLAAAMRQGDADFQESRAVADRCAGECNAPRAINQPLLCSASCSDKTQLSRVSACEKPTWLPS